MVNAEVLVLNKHWTAIDIVNVKDCIGKIYNGTAKIVDETYALHDFQSWADISKNAEDNFIQGVNLKFIVPQVIMKICGHFPRYAIKYSRKNIFARDGYRCAYCGKQFKSEDLSIEHIVPRSRGGKSTWENTITACLECNHRKGDKLLHECGMELKIVPHKPEFNNPGGGPNFRCKHKFWQKFIDFAYWNAELENEEKAQG